MRRRCISKGDTGRARSRHRKTSNSPGLMDPRNISRVIQSRYRSAADGRALIGKLSSLKSRVTRVLCISLICTRSRGELDECSLMKFMRNPRIPLSTSGGVSWNSRRLSSSLSKQFFLIWLQFFFFYFRAVFKTEKTWDATHTLPAR